MIWHKRETAPQACILAILYEEGGDFDQAKKFYKNAMDLDPEN
ncbi:tetratricopeptide repeat protein [Pseudoalteromonas sp. '520P1 No. 412']